LLAASLECHCQCFRTRFFQHHKHANDVFREGCRQVGGASTATALRVPNQAAQNYWIQPVELMFGRPAAHWNTAAKQIEHRVDATETHRDELAARRTDWDRQLVAAHAAARTEMTL